MIFFISDSHLGSQDRERENYKSQKLLSFLDHIKSRAEALYIVGDLFDFWFEYRHVIPKYNPLIIWKLAELVHGGVSVHYVAGNHDYWLGSFLENQVGMTIHVEPVDINHMHQKIFIAHGDGIIKKDRGYRILKKILRNPLSILLFRLLHPDWGVSLANLVSRASRTASENKELDREFLEDIKNFVYEKFESGFDYVILGHLHCPTVERENGKVYINLGDWMRHFTYGLLKDEKLTLNYWEK